MLTVGRVCLTRSTGQMIVSKRKSDRWLGRDVESRDTRREVGDSSNDTMKGRDPRHSVACLMMRAGQRGNLA